MMLTTSRSDQEQTRSTECDGCGTDASEIHEVHGFYLCDSCIRWVLRQMVLRRKWER